MAVVGCTSDGAEMWVDEVVVVGGAADAIGWFGWAVDVLVNDDGVAAAPVAVWLLDEDCIVVNKNALLSVTFAPVRITSGTLANLNQKDVQL